MFTICCTSKLLKRTNLPPETSPPVATTALGNWYANILYFSKRQLLLFVSENSRLAVVTPARDARSLDKHLTQHLSNLLVHSGVPSEWIEAELRQMADVHFAAARDRSVLGTMNEYKFQIEVMLDDLGDVTHLEIAKELRSFLVGPIKYRYPIEAASDLLKRRYLTAGDDFNC